MDIRAFLLIVALVILNLLVYYPFFRAYEKQKLQEETEQEVVA